MFSYFDLIAPIGTALLAVVLCIWAAVKADKLSAKLVSTATMLVFVAAVPVLYFMRWTSAEVDYTTLRGLGVVQGKLNICDPSTVSIWEDELVKFWTPHFAKVSTAFEHKRLICKDAEKISIGSIERFVRGYSTGTTAVIGWRDLNYAHSLFRHEMSHIILFQMGISWNETIHHQKMLEYKLGD